MKTFPVFLNGDLTITEKTFVVKNPATGEGFARMSLVDRSGVTQAIQHAHEAFPGWRHLSGKGRGEMLHKIASEMHRRREEIARLITLENGKPLTQSQGEVAMATDHLRWFAEEARRAYGRVIPHQVDEKRHLIFKTPIGVVGAISPWNFPLVLAVRKVAPALAAGCPVILKPASRTPLCASVFAECVNAVGLPRAVFQLIAGSAAEIGQEFLDNPLCRKISFTGSTEVGKKLIESAAKQVKPLSLELGGHAPVLVFEDADLNDAIEGTLLAKFRNTGQSCIAANRIYVQRSVYEPFLKAFVERTRALKVGDGLDPEVQIGPLIDEQAMVKALEHVQDAVRGGARLLCGGKRIERAGFFFEPTVLADVPKGSLEAGMIGINDGVPTATQAPFGGVKQSGWGRELGSEGLDAFLDTKHISIGI